MTWYDPVLLDPARMSAIKHTRLAHQHYGFECIQMTSDRKYNCSASVNLHLKNLLVQTVSGGILTSRAVADGAVSQVKIMKNSVTWVICFFFVSPHILSCSDSCLILAEILRNNFRFGQSYVCVCEPGETITEMKEFGKQTNFALEWTRQKTSAVVERSPPAARAAASTTA